jgi:hypothetical protein
MVMTAMMINFDGDDNNNKDDDVDAVLCVHSPAYEIKNEENFDHFAQLNGIHIGFELAVLCFSFF